MADHSEGSTPAAWTTVSIIFLGFLIGGLGIPLTSLPMVIVGGAIIVVGAIVGKIMQVMGFGATEKPASHNVAAAPAAATPTTPEPESSPVSAG